LARYALGARNHTVDAEKRSLAHARAILGDGEVTITLADIIDDVVVSRAASDEEPRAQDIFAPPLVLSQTEVETLGLSDAGRLQLLDTFVGVENLFQTEEAAAISAVRSAFREIAALETEIASASDGLDQIPILQLQIDDLEKQEQFYKASSGEVAQKQGALRDVASKSASLAV
jgi:hypothetical protein